MTENNTLTLHLFYFLKGAPRIDHRQHDLLNRIAVEVNSPVNITLYLIAYPKPQMRWIFKNNEVNSTSISNGITNILKLYIPRLAANQFGEYILYVQNAAGSMIKYVTFIKKGNLNLLSLTLNMHIQMIKVNVRLMLTQFSKQLMK